MKKIIIALAFLVGLTGPASAYYGHHYYGPRVVISPVFPLYPPPVYVAPPVYAVPPPCVWQNVPAYDAYGRFAGYNHVCR